MALIEGLYDHLFQTISYQCLQIKTSNFLLRVQTDIVAELIKFQYVMRPQAIPLIKLPPLAAKVYFILYVERA